MDKLRLIYLITGLLLTCSAFSFEENKRLSSKYFNEDGTNKAILKRLNKDGLLEYEYFGTDIIMRTGYLEIVHRFSSRLKNGIVQKQSITIFAELDGRSVWDKDPTNVLSKEIKES